VFVCVDVRAAYFSNEYTNAGGGIPETSRYVRDHKKIITQHCNAGAASDNLR